MTLKSCFTAHFTRYFKNSFTFCCFTTTSAFCAQIAVGIFHSCCWDCCFLFIYFFLMCPITLYLWHRKFAAFVVVLAHLLYSALSFLLLYASNCCGVNFSWKFSIELKLLPGKKLLSCQCLCEWIWSQLDRLDLYWQQTKCINGYIFTKYSTFSSDRQLAKKEENVS